MAKYNATAQGLQCKGSQRLSRHGVILTRAQQKALGTVEYQQQRGNNFGWPHWHNWGGHRSGINCIVMIFDLVEVRPTKQRERSYILFPVLYVPNRMPENYGKYNPFVPEEMHYSARGICTFRSPGDMPHQCVTPLARHTILHHGRMCERHRDMHTWNL